MELRAIHRLPDGDPASSPACHRIPRHLTADRKAAGRLGVRKLWDACGGHPAHVRTVPNRHPQGGVRGAPVSDFSHPGALREAADGGEVDHREGDRGRTTDLGEVYTDRGEGDGGAENQASRCPPINSGQPGLVPGPPNGACTG